MQILGQNEFDHIHDGDDKDLQHSVQAALVSGQYPKRHTNLSRPDELRDQPGMASAQDPRNDLLLPRHQAKHFAKQAETDPNCGDEDV